ncbi:MAG: molecular chaperone DnaJ [Planctomycetota bacterium]
MSSKRDFYEVLEIPKTASQDEIKKAFRTAVKKYHPDTVKDPDKKKEAEVKFKEAAEAYEILSDENKRHLYDQGGHEAFAQQGGYQYQQANIQDILEQVFGGGRGGGIFGEFFGGGGGGGGGGAHAGPRPGRSVRGELEISFEEAYHGATHTLELPRNEHCPTCSGSGAAAGTKPKICAICGGSGFVTRNAGFFAMRSTCPRCEGNGTMIENPCATCRGTGFKRKKVEVTVRIPPGTMDGMRLRVPNEGEPGDPGALRGDLQVIIHVRQHELFTRHNDDLLMDLPVSVTMAALGGEIEIPTVDKKLMLTIHKGTQTGKKYRLRGYGMPNVEGYGRGDIIVNVYVVTPTDLTKDQERLLKQLAETLPDPRTLPSTEKKGFFRRMADWFSE